MDKTKALQLIKDLTEASVNHYAVVNGQKRGKPEAALAREVKAALNIAKHLTTETVTAEDIQNLW